MKRERYGADMTPITIEMVQDAYLKTGLEPVRRHFGNGETTGCPLTALAKCHGFKNPTSWAKTWVESDEYACGFCHGVDGKRYAKKVITRARYFDGYARGLAVQYVLFEKAQERE